MVQSMTRTVTGLAAVVLGWNHCEDSLACVQSVLQADLSDVHVWFVDNGSTDGSPLLLKQAFADITVVELGENRGLAAGYNAGVEAALVAGYEYICVFNNDVVVQPHALQALMNATGFSERVGIWVPKIVLRSDTGTIWSAGARWRRFPPGIVQRGMGSSAQRSYNEPEFVGYATSCSWMMSAHIVRDIGLFDPRYSFYYSDYEYCRRATTRNWQILYVPDAVIAHKVSLSTRNASHPARWWRNLGEAEAIYFRQHETIGQLWVHALWIMLRTILQGDMRHLPAYLAGLKRGSKR